MTSLPVHGPDQSLNVSPTSIFVESTSSNILRETSQPLSTSSGGFLTPLEKVHTNIFSEIKKPKRRGKRRRNSSLTGRGRMKDLLEENQKLRKEVDAMQNQISEFQAQMPSIYDDIEAKTNEISYLKNALESSQKKCHILNQRQQKMELNMTWNDEDMQEQLNKISTKSNAEVESIKDRLFQQVNRLTQELSLEAQERNVLVNDLLLVKKQLAKLRKDKDDEREAYLYNIAEIERVSREAKREKDKYRIKIEEMREHIFELESELEKKTGLVAEQEQLLQSQREELCRVDNRDSIAKKPSSVSETFLTGSLAVELSHNENLIAELREERINAEDELADSRELLENVLELMEYAVSVINPDIDSGDGVSQLENAIVGIRDYFGLQPLQEEQPGVEKLDQVQGYKSPESFNDLNLFDDNLLLERKSIETGLNEVDLEILSTKKKNTPVVEVPKPLPTPSTEESKINEFKQAVFKEVTKMKKDILEEFKQLTQEHLRTSVTDGQLMDNIQNSTQNSANAVIDWMERNRKNTQVLESASNIERLRVASQRSLEDQQMKKNLIIERLKKKMAGLEATLETANVEIGTLKEQRRRDAVERLRLKAGNEKKKVDQELNVATQEVFSDSLTEEKNTVRVHRLETMAGLTTNQQRECVSGFLVTYSESSSWQTFRDPNLQTTIYMFEFDGTMWKTRISFLYPFVNYLTQVIGVNKKALGSIFIILPTSTVASKINHLSSSFRQMLKTLETHNSDSLWNYIFIFLKNVATHYGNIKRFVGSRTRTINPGYSSKEIARQNSRRTKQPITSMQRNKSQAKSSNGARELAKM